MKIWTTKDGRKLPLHDMETVHLKNALAMLRRNGFVSADEFSSALSAAYSLQGEMASYYAENAIGDLKIAAIIDAMEYELAKRGAL